MIRAALVALALLLTPAVAAAQLATLLQTVTDETDSNSYSFASQNLGAAAADRVIVAVVSARKSGGAASCPAPAAVTIQGITSNLVVTASSPVSAVTCNVMSIHAASVTALTTGTVIVSFGATVHLRVHVALYRITGTAGGSPTAFASGSSIADDPTGTLTIPANGAGIGGSLSVNTGTVTWTGLTETYEEMAGTTATNVTSGALLTPSTLQTSLAITADWSAFTQSVGVWASWEPSGVAPATTPTLTLRGVGAEDP